MTVVAAIVVLALGALLSPSPDTDVLARFAPLAVIVAFGSVVAYEVFTGGGCSIDAHGIGLSRSIRRRDGSRTRTLSFEEIVDVKPTVLKKDSGVLVVLKDGATVCLTESVFDGRGLAIMTSLAARYGHDYQEELKPVLLQGGDGYGFKIAVVRGIADGSVLLKRSIPTYSGRSIRSLSPADIAEVERVTTPYAGDAVLVTLRDRTRFLLCKADAESVRILDPHSLA